MRAAASGPRRRVIAFACLLALHATGAGAERSFSLDDLLSTEGFGRMRTSPSGRWLVFERDGSFAEMPRYDMLMQNQVLRSTPFVVDLTHPTAARPLLPENAGASTVIYDFSPDGSRIAVARLREAKWQLGVVTVASRTVRWFAVSPDYNPFAHTLAWISPNRLVLIAEQKGAWPWWLRDGHAAGSPVQRRWRDMRHGGPASVTALGSGRFRSSTPRPPDKDLRLIDLGSGKQTVLAAGPIEDIRVSPDGRHIAQVVRGDIVAPSPAEPLSPNLNHWRRRLSVVEVATRRSTSPCGTCDIAGSPSWSPDASGLVFFGRQDGQRWDQGRILRTNQNGSLLDLAAAGFVPIVLGPPNLPPTVRLAWRNRDLLAFGRTASSPDKPPGWFAITASGPIPLAEGESMPPPVIVQTADCKATMITSQSVWCADSPKPFLLASGIKHAVYDGDATDGQLLTIDRDNRVFWPGRPSRAPVTLRNGDSVEPASTHIAQSSVIVSHRDDNGVSTLLLLQAGRRTRMATVNERLAEVRPAEAMPLHHRIPGGSIVTSWLLLPPGNLSGRRLPLVTIPYPGQTFGDTPPTDQMIDSSAFEGNAQLLASHGYAVLLPSLPDMTVSDRAPLDLAAEVGAAVNAALLTGRIDDQRLALWGHSFGGYAAALISSKTDRYKAVIASAGLYDLAALAGVFTPASRATPEYGTSGMNMYGWLETGQADMGAKPWIDPERYRANSPFYRAAAIHTPMMIVTADWDIAPISQAEQMFGALDRDNKDAILLTYWGEGHVIGSPDNVRDMYRRIFEWLDQCFSEARPTIPSRQGDSATRVTNTPIR